MERENADEENQKCKRVENHERPLSGDERDQDANEQTSRCPRGSGFSAQIASIPYIDSFASGRPGDGLATGDRTRLPVRKASSTISAASSTPERSGS